MKKRVPDNRRAFTLNDVFVIIVMLVVLGAILLPMLAKPKVRSARANCANNLKQVALAFRIWEGDNNDRFPMLVSTNQGGTMEWVDGPNAWRHFEVMSNELNTPRILDCPNETDSSRKIATVFGPVPPGLPGRVGFTENSNLSYFVGVDATSTNASMFLAGDRNLTNGTPVKDGMLLLTTNSPSGWTEKMHVHYGNVAMADGSVQMFSTSLLREAVRHTGVATNRLARP
jgi:prepilin-type processing-associated H-X9-DG protein